MDDDSDFEIVPGPNSAPAETESAEGDVPHEYGKQKKKFVHPKKTAEERKKDKESRRSRKARIILRNISYKVNEKNLTERFGKYGTIKECNLLKRADGKLVGCAFIQYEKVNQAAKAIHHENAKEFLGRPVVIDWAVNRKKFASHQREERKTKVKVEDGDDDDVSIKSEPESDAEAADDKSDESAAEESDEEDAESDGDGANIKEEEDDDADDKKTIHKRSNDVAEGCTVFIKNVPFEATSADLRKVCSQFGPLYYAVITADKVSGHSKGTGFVKYKSPDSANMCCSAGTSFKLFDQVLDPHAALSRHEVQQKAENNKKEPADSRNLYLVKEGLILAGTPAAEGVSQADMAKRLRLEQSKSQLLRNLNRFVSKDRLTIHNIPPSFDSVKLRKIISKVSGLKPKECRVMRENKPSMGQPLGKSKGYGFISFGKHEEALLCIRKVNNNPHAFGKNNRPIVSFSIEDRAAHNLKEKRLQKSRDLNPLCKKKSKGFLDKKQKKMKKNADVDVKPNPKKLQIEKKPKVTESEVANFAGLTSEKGSQYKTRPLWKLREEATAHGKKTSDDKSAKKQLKKEKAHLRERKAVDRTKQGKRKNEADGQLVNKYLRMLHTDDTSVKQPKAKRSKWYTE